MPVPRPPRAHVIAGGFPPGAHAGHDHDFARLRILEYLAEQDVQASVGNDFEDVEKWLPLSQLLITYVAGPIPGPEQDRAIRRWIEAGGRWLGLHGTSGGKAARVPDRPHARKMVKTEHHETLGGFFINHPPVRRFQVDVHAAGDALTDGLPASFEVIDEPYMIEVLDPASTRILLTAELGPDTSPPGFGFVYDRDTALQPDGKTRVLGYTRDVGKGGVTYIALGHAHTPATNVQPFVDTSVDPEGKTPPTLRVTWEGPAFQALLRNGIAWGTGTS
ncbi:MAG: ThuA domain-containing protein [Dehalococcoidia bacterium]|nr:ThuA domain-containing protein [Dehalococcoidia bacterium]